MVHTLKSLLLNMGAGSDVLWGTKGVRVGEFNTGLRPLKVAALNDHFSLILTLKHWHFCILACLGTHGYGCCGGLPHPCSQRLPGMVMTTKTAGSAVLAPQWPCCCFLPELGDRAAAGSPSACTVHSLLGAPGGSLGQQPDHRQRSGHEGTKSDPN